MNKIEALEQELEEVKEEMVEDYGSAAALMLDAWIDALVESIADETITREQSKIINARAAKNQARKEMKAMEAE